MSFLSDMSSTDDLSIASMRRIADLLAGPQAKAQSATWVIEPNNEGKLFTVALTAQSSVRLACRTGHSHAEIIHQRVNRGELAVREVQVDEPKDLIDRFSADSRI